MYLYMYKYEACLSKHIHLFIRMHTKALVELISISKKKKKKISCGM